jgi:hypothetical protein
MKTQGLIARNEGALSMPTRQESGPRLQWRFPRISTQQKVRFTASSKKEFFFNSNEAGMCMKTKETWTK